MKPNKICLIEDHEILWALTQQELTEAWYSCDRYTSREDDIKIHQYDCFILDVMLPGYDGFQIWSIIRKQSEVGVIYLTAKLEFTDKKIWFDIWADDYLTKPFVMNELILRISAIIKRTPNRIIQLSTWITIDLAKRMISKDSTDIHCTPIERHVLQELIENIWRPCSRVMLVEAWRGEDSLFSMSRSLDVTIANLRSKLWKESIITIPKVWYQIL
jgi:DNA-binding response OmpR family regulator